jgi:uncharacterized alpha-E superfamily protein
MLSRIADSLFWLNRYMERSDCMLTGYYTNYILSFDATNSTSFSWKDTIGIFTYGAEEVMNTHSESTAAALNYLINDTKNLNAVKNVAYKSKRKCKRRAG